MNDGGLNGRARQVLERFPVHLGAAQASKRLGAVANVVAGALDELSAQIAGVRRSHRLKDADNTLDLSLLAALHGIGDDDLGLLELRRDALRSRVDALSAAPAGEPREQAAKALLQWFGIQGPAATLARFAPESGDLEQAAVRLAERALSLVASANYLERMRDRVRTICAIHAQGNGTTRAILMAVANALDLDLDLSRNLAVKRALSASRADPQLLSDGDLFHSVDHFWHASFVTDRVALGRRVEVAPPPKRVSARASIIVVELAAQMALPSRDLLTQAGALGIPVTRADATLSFADAEKLAAALGFTLERVGAGSVALGRSIKVRELAARMALGVEPLLQRLTELGEVVSADSSLDPETAARAARKFGYVIEQTLLPELPEEIIGIEENPLHLVEHEQEDVAHAQRFSLLRRGFGRVLLRTTITGVGNRTMTPMLVNRDEGRGIGFVGSVPDGKRLIFDAGGRVSWDDGADATARCFSFSGAVFADAEQPHERDFVFAGAGADPVRCARMVITEPGAALDREAELPHADNALVVPGIGLGETRFAFFVREAHAGSRDASAPNGVRAVTPLTKAGVFDGAAFAFVPSSEAERKDPWKIPRLSAARLQLSWREHEAYAVRVLVPPRFLTSDAVETKARLAAALERFRPLGVAIRIESVDERWLLGEGLLSSAAAQDPLLLLRGGTALWPTPPSA